MEPETVASDAASDLTPTDTITGSFWVRVRRHARDDTWKWFVDNLLQSVGAPVLVGLAISFGLDTWGGTDLATGALVSAAIAFASVAACSLVYFVVRMASLPPIMEREMVSAHDTTLRRLYRTMEDQTSEATRLRLQLTDQSRTNLLVMPRCDSREVLLTVSTSGPDVAVTATARVVYASRPNEAPGDAFH